MPANRAGTAAFFFSYFQDDAARTQLETLLLQVVCSTGWRVVHICVQFKHPPWLACGAFMCALKLLWLAITAKERICVFALSDRAAQTAGDCVREGQPVARHPARAQDRLQWCFASSCCRGVQKWFIFFGCCYSLV